MADTDRVDQWWATASQSSLESEFRECLSTGGPAIMDAPPDARFKQGRVLILSENSRTEFGFTNIGAFQTRLEEIANPAIKERLLIVLEDLGKEWVELLGSILMIPVYFFALHWALPIDHLMRTIQLPAGQSPEQHFILPYQQLLPFRITRSNLQDNQVFLNSISVRDVSVGGGELSGDTCDQLVSYWGKCSGPDKWIAIILVDPFPIQPSTPLPTRPTSATPAGPTGVTPAGPTGVTPAGPIDAPDVGTKPSELLWTARRADLDSETWRFWRRLPGQVHLDISNRDDRDKILNQDDREKIASPTREDASVRLSTPIRTESIRDTTGDLGLPIFDQFCKIEVGKLVKGNTPLHATSYIQRVVLAHAIALVRRSTYEIDKLTLDAAKDAKRIREFSMQDVLEFGWSGEWKGRFYTRMWELRENLQQSIYMLKEAGKTIMRINIITTLRDSEKPQGNTLQPEVNIKYGIENNACDLWEWENVDSTANFALQMLDRTRDTYVEAVQATAAKLANDQAVSSRKISGYAAVFVPASITAAVLAIPSFSQDADATRFWIFWVVSVPLAIFAWIWFMTPLPSWLARTRKDLHDPELKSWKEKEYYLRELAKATVGRELTPSSVPARLVRERNRGRRPRASV